MHDACFPLTTVCYHCGRTSTHHQPMSGQTEPMPGDWSVCLRCATISVYMNGPLGIMLRAPTIDELDEAHADPEVCRLIATVKTANARLN